MNKTMKRKSIIFASVACAVLTGSAFGVLGMNSNTAIQASAETTTLTESSFVMPGASVRIATDKNGIRFPVWLPEKVYEANQTSIIETGTLLCPKAMYDSNQLTVEAYQSETSKTDGAITTDKWVEYTDPKTGTVYYQSMIYLYNIPTTDMETEIMARGYVKIGDQTLYSPIITRSMAEVAYQAMQDPEYASHATTLQSYLGDYVVEMEAQSTFETYASMSGTTPEANDLTIDLSSYDNTITEVSVAAIVDGERTVLDSQYISVAEKVVTVQGEAFGASVYGDVDLQIITDNNAFETSINVVTKYINNKADLENMRWYGGMNASIEGMPYDGYFVMTADIDCANVTLNHSAGNETSTPLSGNSYVGTSSYGFAGVFDGKGHKVYNMALTNYSYGVFGNTQQGSVIKNVAFCGTVLTTADWCGFVLGRGVSSEITNCYIDFVVDGSSTNNEHFLLGQYLSNTKMTDVVIKYDTSAVVEKAWNQSFFGYTAADFDNWNWVNRISCTNVYAFSTTQQAWCLYWNLSPDAALSISNGQAEIMASVSNNAYDATVSGVTMTDSTYWNLAGDQPIFKSVGGATRTINYTGNTYQTTAFETYDNVIVNYTEAAYQANVTGYTLTPNTFSVDLNGYNLPTNPTTIKLIGEKASKNIDTNCFSNGVLTIADLGSDIYGEVSVEFTTTDCVYKVSSFNVVTKYIDDSDDLWNMFFYGNVDLTDDLRPYDGYFVMRADVGSLTGAPQFRMQSSVINYSCGYPFYNGNAGFKGVFDGQGHTIDFMLWGGYPNGNGIFGCTQIGSEIKNVNFKANIQDLSQTSWSWPYLLGTGISSAFTNCCFDISTAAACGNASKGDYAIFAYAMTYSSMKDCVIKADIDDITCGDLAWLCYAPGNMQDPYWVNPQNYITFENVHVFTNVEKGWIYLWDGDWLNHVKTGYTLNAYDATVSGITMTDPTYWDLTGNQPVWKGVTNA